jgi:hypothetical protein
MSAGSTFWPVATASADQAAHQAAALVVSNAARSDRNGIGSSRRARGVLMPAA